MEGGRIENLGGKTEPNGSKYGMVAAYPELPHEEGPELLSIVSSVEEMVLKKGRDIFRVEKPLPPDSFGGKHVFKQFPQRSL